MYSVHSDVADPLENHIVLHANNNIINQPKHAAHLIRDKRFSTTMWYVRPAKPQISSRIRAI